MTKSNYKRLGDYIQRVDVKNQKLITKELLGINIDNYFMPSVANIIGTDLSKYKLVYKNQFACNRMHIGRDDRIPVAISKNENPFIVSPAYDVFEVTNENSTLPDYLMIWMKRREFDRECTFHTDADVRGGLPWEDFCDLQFPIPSIEKQRAIVAEYNTIQNRINLNRQLIQKLEETAQAIYKEWFVEGIDEENLPEGWRVSQIGDEVETLGGGTPSTENEEYWKDGNILWYSPTDITNGKSLFTSNSQSKITEIGLQKSSAKLFPAYSLMMTSRATIGKIAINTVEATTNQGFITLIPTKELQVYFLFDWIKTQLEEINNLASGSTFLEISKTDFRNLNMVIPDKIILEKYNKLVLPIFETIKLKSLENQKLTELEALLLARMVREE